MAWDGKQKIYWRCAGYKPHACNTRAISQVIDGSCPFFLSPNSVPVKLIMKFFCVIYLGYDMVKVNGHHTHPPEHFDTFAQIAM